jgi:hypothetical protein
MRPAAPLLTALAVLALLPAAAFAAPAPKTVSGPAGLKLLPIAETVACPPGTVAVGVRPTAASRRRGVRSVRFVVQGTGVRKVVSVARGGLKRAALRATCSRSFRVKVEARNRRGRVVASKSYRVAPRQAVGDDGRPIGGGTIDPGADVADPLGGGPIPGSKSPDGITPTEWNAAADPRRSGTRSGQTCAQVTSRTAAGEVKVYPTYCGLLTQDAVFAATRALEEPTGAGTRLVLAGVADVARVGSVSVTGPSGTQQLALSASRDGIPNSGGAFIAVFDGAAVQVGDLTLVVALKDGTTQTYASPSSVNLRNADGSRL